MNEMIMIVFKVVPIILLMALGIFCEKAKILSVNTIHGMKKMVQDFSLPSLLFLTFLNSELKSEYLLIVVVMFIVCILSLAMGYLFKKLHRSANQLYPAVFSSYATGMVGYSLFIPVFGSDQLYKLAILDIGNILFIFVILSNFLERISCGQTSRKKISIRDQIEDVVKSPIVISMFLGILISVSGKAAVFQSFPATSALISSLTMIGNTTVPLILLVLGYELHFDLKNFMAPAYAVFLRIGMMVTLAYILNRFIIDELLGLDEMFQMALYTMFILPPTLFIPVFIEGECEEKGFVLNFLSIHLLLTILAFILLLTAVR